MMGFFGKLPCRGDFVRGGLPGGFVSAWDGWMSAVLAAGQARFGGAWSEAWLEAPVWRFALPAEQCGPDGVLGVWLPSVDGAGRYFPLTIAAVFAGAPPVCAAAWLDAAEEIGRAAVAFDTEPAALGAALTELGFPVGGSAELEGRWWTDGAPRVAAQSFTANRLPRAARFAAMVGGWAE